MFWETLLVLAITLAIISVTIILVMREFKRVNKSITREEDVSRTNEATIKRSVKTTSSNLTQEIANTTNTIISTVTAADESLYNAISGSNATLDSKYTSVSEEMRGEILRIDGTLQEATASIDDLSLNYATVSDEVASMDTVIDTMSPYMGSNIDGTKYLSADQFRLSQARVTFDPVKGVTMSNQSPSKTYDLTVPSVSVGTSLNLAGTLNFASQNSSYMLGVDGTSMYLKLGQGSDFTIRDHTDTNRLRVNRDNVTIDDAALNINNDANSYMFGLEGRDLFLKPSTAEGKFIVRDLDNNSRLQVASDKVAITGDIVSDTKLCVNSSCLNETDIMRLKQMANV